MNLLVSNKRNHINLSIMIRSLWSLKWRHVIRKRAKCEELKKIANRIAKNQHLQWFSNCLDSGQIIYLISSISIFSAYIPLRLQESCLSYRHAFYEFLSHCYHPSLKLYGLLIWISRWSFWSNRWTDQTWNFLVVNLPSFLFFFNFLSFLMIVFIKRFSILFSHTYVLNV